MADFNQDTYQPMDGDLYIVEVMCELEQEAKQAQPPAKSYEEIETEIQVIKEEVNSQD